MSNGGGRNYAIVQCSVSAPHTPPGPRSTGVELTSETLPQEIIEAIQDLLVNFGISALRYLASSAGSIELDCLLGPSLHATLRGF